MSSVGPVIFWLLSLALVLLQKRKISSAVLFGKRYYTKCELVNARVKELVWNGRDGYSASCAVLGVSLKIEIPIDEKHLRTLSKRLELCGPDGAEVYLIRSTIVGAFVYQFAPITDAAIKCSNTSTPTRTSLEDDEIGALRQKIRYGYIVKYALMAVAIFSFLNYPFASILFSSLVIYANELFVDFKGYTKHSGSCIIKGINNGKVSRPCGDFENFQYPEGYRDWSETEKMLYEMETRAEFRKTQYGDSDTTAFPVAERRSPVCSNTGSDSDVTFKLCHNCGCVYDLSTITCSHYNVALATIGSRNAPSPESENEDLLDITDEELGSNIPSSNSSYVNEQRERRKEILKTTSVRSIIEEFDGFA